MLYWLYIFLCHSTLVVHLLPNWSPVQMISVNGYMYISLEQCPRGKSWDILDVKKQKTAEMNFMFKK